MFSLHEGGIPTNRQLKITEEVKTLVDKMKNLYKCNFNRKNSRKANKTNENFKEKSFSLRCPLFREGCASGSSRLIYHTSRSSITQSFYLGEVPINSIQDPQCNIDSSTVVLGRLIVFFFSICFGK